MRTKTLRSEIKWAKVSGSAGRYIVAFGWKGEFEAAHRQIYPSMQGALIAAKLYVEDRG